MSKAAGRNQSSEIVYSSADYKKRNHSAESYAYHSQSDVVCSESDS